MSDGQEQVLVFELTIIFVYDGELRLRNGGLVLYSNTLDDFKVKSQQLETLAS